MTEPEAPRRLRWWFPALFVIAGVAAVVAIVAALQRDDTPAPSLASATTTTFPDLASFNTDAPQPEDAAPGFSVRTLDGSTFTLADHLATDGRPLFLNLWATWCGPCRAEMPILQDASEAHPEVRFVGVAIEDSERSVADFVAEIGVTYNIGLDDDNVVRDAYPTLGMPTTFLIDPGGSIAKTHIGIVTAETVEELLIEAFGS
jgi:thiol-disulfide isomerase/thioredoxin